MKTIRYSTRNQLVMTGMGLLLLGVVAIVPWRVVAQDQQPAANGAPAAQKNSTDPDAAPASAPTDGKDSKRAAGAKGQKSSAQANDPKAAAEAKEKAAKAQAAAEKLIVGTWRGGASGKDVLIVQKDGAYGWLFQNDNQAGAQGGIPELVPVTSADGNTVIGYNPGQPSVGAAPKYANSSGRWKIENETLVLTQDDASPQLRGFRDATISDRLPNGFHTPDAWPTDFATAPGQSGMKARLDIVRLDDSWLRLVSTLVDPQTGAHTSAAPKFFRRVAEQEATPKFTAETPQELKRIAELARLNAEEAQCLAKWIADVNQDRKTNKQEPLHFDYIEQGLAARSGKVDFQALFHLTAGEASAYHDLLKLAENFGSTCVLAEQGQLTPVELAALNKLKKYKTETDAVNLELMRGLARGGAQAAPGPMVFMAPGAAGPVSAYGGVSPAGAPAVGADANPATANGSSSDKATYEMLSKLQTLLIELDSWLVNTVYN